MEQFLQSHKYNYTCTYMYMYIVHEWMYKHAWCHGNAFEFHASVSCNIANGYQASTMQLANKWLAIVFGQVRLVQAMQAGRTVCNPVINIG